MKRIKLRDRRLPDYTRSEEIMNMVTHIVGGGIGVIGLVLCLARAVRWGDGFSIVGALVYGISVMTMFFLP